MIRYHHIARTCGIRPIYVNITADDDDSNIFTLAGSPGSAAVVYVLVYPGVKVTWLHTGTGWAAGSIIGFVNYGTTAGRGGAGGGGGAAPNAGVGGSDGGAALELQDANVITFIDTANGYLFGGGGGGGGGAADIAGTGGAGGGGYPNGASGGGSAGPGTWSGGGTPEGGSGLIGASGGYGGWPGDPGEHGGGINDSLPGGTGGNAGSSIKSNGHTYYIVAGDDSTHIKGPKT